MTNTIQILERTEYQTVCGTLVPLYEEDTQRMRSNRSVALYEDGSLASISLHEQTPVKTPLGDIPAECVTFYPGGAVKRVLPTNGNLSGFWSETDEIAYSPELTLALPFGTVTVRVISLYFYESGRIKSVTLWPGETIDVPTRYGELPTRIGVSFYEDGSIKSLEPAFPLDIHTALGDFKAYDCSAVGVNGDLSSMQFDATGYLTALTTSVNSVDVATADGTPVRTHGPFISYEAVVPLTVGFSRGLVTLDGIAYSTDDHAFTIGQASFMEYSACPSDCASCAGCGIPEE